MQKVDGMFLPFCGLNQQAGPTLTKLTTRQDVTREEGWSTRQLMFKKEKNKWLFEIQVAFFVLNTDASDISVKGPERLFSPSASHSEQQSLTWTHCLGEFVFLWTLFTGLKSHISLHQLHLSNKEIKTLCLWVKAFLRFLSIPVFVFLHKLKVCKKTCEWKFVWLVES